MKNKYLPSLVTGFGAAVLLSIPLVKNVGCCVVIPFAAIYALSLDVKLNKAQLPIKGKEAFLFGLMTGLWAAIFSALFETLITFIAHSNDFVLELPTLELFLKNQAPDYLKPFVEPAIPIYRSIANDIKTSGFSPLYTFAVLFINIIVDIIFGVIGGFIGMNYLNKRDKLKQ
ncbi:MAG: hypothetical protein P4L35_04190 [Ignavibacteriaceae bacterium]|nr:hypothetical protein [Ignavibacteriaceae bacterium]